MGNKPYRLWAVTMPDYSNGKLIGRRVDHSTIRYLKRDAIAAWKDWYSPDQRAAMWGKYRKQHDLRAERVVVTVEDAQ